MKTKTCPKCSSKHTKSGTYCSRSCANSRNFSAESRKKKSQANKAYWDSLSSTEQKKKRQLFLSTNPNTSEKYYEYLFDEDWTVLGIQAKRLRVILEQNGKCSKCGIDKWLGERITLEYEHKDGDNTNNNRDNVEALCPNCHSQTTTWRGKKNGKNQKRVEKFMRKVI